MPKSLPPLGWIRSFEAAARHQSFAGAAEELNLTPAAVSQQIRALEQHVGIALFERLPRGVRLTESARAWQPAVHRAIDELALSTASLFGSRATRTVTLRATISFSVLCLAPVVAELGRAHPELELELYSSVWGDDLDRARIDLEIRYGDGRWPGYRIERLTAPRSVVVCPPALALSPGPVGLAHVVRQGVIHIAGCEDMWTRLTRRNGVPEGDLRRRDRVDTSLAALEMVATGRGSALISHDLARQHLARGSVALLPGIELVHDQAHYLLIPARGGEERTEALVLARWLKDTFGHRDAVRPAL
jgi:LysR family transcriptional regulator, glycine cleavage system transcriptional activator